MSDTDVASRVGSDARQCDITKEDRVRELVNTLKQLHRENRL